MSSVTVYSKEELKRALKSDAMEITIKDSDLAKRVKLLGKLKKAGPVAVGAVIAAVPLIPLTGGTSLVAALTGTMGLAGVPISAAVVWLVVAIGGVLLISLLTDWEHVQVGKYIVLKRKPKERKQA